MCFRIVAFDLATVLICFGHFGPAKFSINSFEYIRDLMLQVGSVEANATPYRLMFPAFPFQPEDPAQEGPTGPVVRG